MNRVSGVRIAAVAAAAVVVVVGALVAAPAEAAAKASVERVSVKANGTQFAKGGAGAVLSADGMHVAFVTPNFDISPRKHRI